MNILILSHFSGSPQHGMVYRNYVMAQEWIKQGHSVTIVTSSYSHFRQSQPTTKKRISQDLIESVPYIWVWSPQYDASSSIGRVLSMLAFTLQLLFLPLPLKKNYDVIICSSPHPFTIYPARKLARKFKARLVYDIRDLWPLTLKFLGNLSDRHPFIWLMQRAENFACKHADLVTSVPQNACEYLHQHGLPKERFLAIANGATIDPATHPVVLSEDYVARLKAIRAKARYVVGYTGTLGTANAMSDAITAMSRIPDDIHLVIIGDGREKPDLIKLTTNLHVDQRVHFLPAVPRNQIASILEHVDIGYAATNDSPLYQYGASLTKINDYMLANLPVLYAVGDPGNPIELSGAGISCKPGSADDIAHALRTLTSLTKSELTDLGQKGHDWCLKHQLVSEQAKLILAKLNSLPVRV